jgi:TetR/AcrR family transcriptional repressor of nem operon
MNKAEKTRQYIVEKTSPIFNRKGYAGTSISDITEATGLTKGSIYGNFQNKDEVALAAFDHNVKVVDSLIRTEMSRYSLAKDRLMVYVHVYSDCLHPVFPDAGCPILNTATEADDTHPELRARASAALIAWKNSIVRIIKKGIESGELKADVDAEAIAVTITAMIEGGVMMSKLTGKMNYLKVVMQSVKKLIDELG